MLDINSENIEMWVMQWADGELNPSEIKAVQDFIAAHPMYGHLYQDFAALKLEPETIVYPHKEALLRDTGIVSGTSQTGSGSKKAFRIAGIALIAVLMLIIVNKVLLFDTMDTKKNVQVRGAKPDMPQKNTDPCNKTVVPKPNNNTVPNVTTNTGNKSITKSAAPSGTQISAVVGISKQETEATKVLEPVALLGNREIQLLTNHTVAKQEITAIAPDVDFNNVFIDISPKEKRQIVLQLEERFTGNELINEAEEVFQQRIEKVQSTYQSLINSSIKFKIGSKEVIIKK